MISRNLGGDASPPSDQLPVVGGCAYGVDRRSIQSDKRFLAAGMMSACIVRQIAGPGPISAVVFADNGYLQPINIAEISDHAVFYCEKRPDSPPIEIG